ncbi:MAG: OB-fold domain-containing protein, partial [Mycetocola sp.]
SSPDVAWTEATGRGEIVTWVVPHERRGAGTAASYVVAIVQLAEGPWIYANGEADAELWHGRPVGIGFAPVDDGEPLPVLRMES